MKTPKLVKNWDIVDTIYFHDAIALWCGVNPQDHEARKDHYQEISLVRELFSEGIHDGLLNFPSSDDPVSSDNHFHITRDDLKSFAKAIRKRPLFLFPRKGKKKTYNIPPKPYTSEIKWPKWEFLKRKEKLNLGQVFEMLFGVNPDFPYTIDRLGFSGPGSGEETESQVLELFLEGINTGYFGDILETYGNYKRGAFCNSEKTYTPLSAVPLPSNKVIEFLKKKNLLDFLRSCNRQIAEELLSILTITPASKKASSKSSPFGHIGQNSISSKKETPASPLFKGLKQGI